jgi:hypothetical protein
MEVAPAPAYQPIDAEDQLNQYLATKGLHSGWIEEKKMYISTGVAFFDSEDPSYDDSFITKRSMKSMEAKLNAKADIIEFINTTMSALNLPIITNHLRYDVQISFFILNINKMTHYFLRISR